MSGVRLGNRSHELRISQTHKNVPRVPGRCEDGRGGVRALLVHDAAGNERAHGSGTAGQQLGNVIERI